jgi:hypothetical protein
MERRLMKWGMEVSRWGEAEAEATAHRAHAVAAAAHVDDVAAARDIANRATEEWTEALARTSHATEIWVAAKQWRREHREKQLRKRTCSVCAKTVPLSARALPYYVGDRGVVPRVDRPRYCGEACLRARLEDG